MFQGHCPPTSETGAESRRSPLLDSNSSIPKAGVRRTNYFALEAPDQNMDRSKKWKSQVIVLQIQRWIIQIIADILTYLTTDNESLVLEPLRYQTQIELSKTRLSILRKRLFLEENDTHPIETELYTEATQLQNLITDEEVKSS